MTIIRRQVPKTSASESEVRQLPRFMLGGRGASMNTYFERSTRPGKIRHTSLHSFQCREFTLRSEAQQGGEKAREVVHGDVPEECRKLGRIAE